MFSKATCPWPLKLAPIPREKPSHKVLNADISMLRTLLSPVAHKVICQQGFRGQGLPGLLWDTSWCNFGQDTEYLWASVFSSME